MSECLDAPHLTHWTAGVAALRVGPAARSWHQAWSSSSVLSGSSCQIPPLVRRSLRIASGECSIPPGAQGCDVEVVPVFPICSSPPGIRLMKYGFGIRYRVTDTRSCRATRPSPKSFVEVFGDGVPGHLPAHPRLHALDVRLRRPRGERESRCRERSNADVGTWSPPWQPTQACSGHPCTPGSEEGAVEDQLTTALKQVEQARLALGPSKSYFFLTASHGIRRARPLTRPRARVKAFSFTAIA